jgi:predicted O-methyltransferase YrrM
VTLEGAPALAALASRHLAALGHGATAGLPPRAEVVVGPFAETLAETCAAHGPFDLVFVDGHHEEAAALSYVDAMLPHLAPGAVVVLDDVEPRRPVARAWRRLRAAHRAAPAVYLGKWGVIALGGPALSAAPLARAEGAATSVARPTGSTSVMDARP